MNSLPWIRKKKESIFEEIVTFVRNNPGVRWKRFIGEIDTPIKYLEIGVFKGENIIDMSKSFCKHPDSVMHCVDPWIDYDGYSEYKGQIESIHDIFMKNMTKENLLNKIVIHRDYSTNVVSNFQNEYFDIAFIDGNHETKYVYEDGVITFPKVKPGGYIIFDDYDWVETKTGIDFFINDYKSKIKHIEKTSHQVFIQKAE